jgi:hypothetical protein
MTDRSHELARAAWDELPWFVLLGLATIAALWFW